MPVVVPKDRLTARYTWLFEREGFSIILPSQIPRSENLSPERHLYQAVLLSAINDLQAPQYRGTEIYEMAKQWVVDADGDYPISFRDAVEHGFPSLDVDLLREAVVKRFCASPTRSRPRIHFVRRGARHA